ncbi:uncharacterized protein LOC110679324 [Aedes aegypti]|uniref:Uncharacterized protein n=1 Tax=Aedes aegypti TaxID=7159 RepID=A0A6I8U4G1_AEDAE|nr:uncharacterized protein LOC110679324 [Aedes aegypti]
MKLHFDSKFCQYPKTYFPFVLNILLWDRNWLTKVCTSCPFYLYSSTFAALYLIVNLFLAAYELFQQILVPIAGPDDYDQKLTVPLRFWKIDLSFRIPHQYLLLGRALFHVQALARSLYNLAVGNFGALLGLVVFVPVFFAMDVINFVTEWSKHRGQPDWQKFIWTEALRLGSTVVFWTNMCCLLYNQYAGCIFDK